MRSLRLPLLPETAPCSTLRRSCASLGQGPAGTPPLAYSGLTPALFLMPHHTTPVPSRCEPIVTRASIVRKLRNAPEQKQLLDLANLVLEG
jgi:hypothetical protein